MRTEIAESFLAIGLRAGSRPALASERARPESERNTLGAGVPFSSGAVS